VNFRYFQGSKLAELWADLLARRACFCHVSVYGDLRAIMASGHTNQGRWLMCVRVSTMICACDTQETWHFRINYSQRVLLLPVFVAKVCIKVWKKPNTFCDILKEHNMYAGCSVSPSLFLLLPLAVSMSMSVSQAVSVYVCIRVCVCVSASVCLSMTVSDPPVSVPVSYVCMFSESNSFLQE